MNKGTKFKLKEDVSSEVVIVGSDVEEIIPDADFRFSLVIMRSGEKYFICGTEQEIREQLEHDL